MIRITKPTVVPARLLGIGKTTDDTNRKQFDADPTNFLNGNKAIKVLNGIYGHDTIKSVLKTAQHNKCCFCEKDQVDEVGNVEHFRPKEGYKSRKKDKLNKPGYFWLGYDWSNLFFVCSRCNSAKYKGNLFPLINEKNRARSHNDDYAKEKPFLVHPCNNKPHKHIEFNNEFPSGVTVRGAETITICGLDREELNGMRRKILNTIDDKVIILLNPLTTQQQKNVAKKFLRECQKPTAPFSSAAKNYLAKNYHIVYR